MSSKWDVIVEAAFGVGPFAEPTAAQWVDLAAGGNGLRALRYRHGKAKRYDPVDPAVLDLVLNNQNGKLDSNWTGSPYSPNVRRDTQVRVTLDSRDTSNLMGIDQAGFERPNLVGWANSVAASLSVSDLQPGEDERALRVEATATGLVRIKTSDRLPATPNTVYTAQAAFLTGAGAAHQPRIWFQFYDAAGAVISSPVSPLLGAPSSIVYSIRSHTVTSPAGTAAVAIFIDFATTAVGNEAAVGDVFFLRRASVAQGGFKPWTRPTGLYPLLRGHALSWTARYDETQRDATCDLVAHDVFRLLNAHKLWPSLVEHDLLDGHTGPLPVSYYPMDERANEADEADVIDRVGDRPGSTSNGVRSSAGNLLQWDPRPFKTFGGGSGQGAQTMFVQSLSSQELDGPWSIDLMFRLQRVGPPVQTILATSEDKLRLFVWEDSTLNFEVFYSNGTSAKITTSFPLVPGPVEHCTLTCEADGTIELWLNRVFRGFAGGGGRVPSWWGPNLLIAADRGGGFGMRGEIGRLSLYNYRRVQGQIEAYNDAIKFPWGFSKSPGARMAFLLAEFRHRKDNAGVTVAGTHPGVPFSWTHVDDPSSLLVQPMAPAERSVLGYMRALEVTEGGYLKVKRNGQIRFRRQSLVASPRAAGMTYDNRAVPVAGGVPYRKAHLGRVDEVISTVTYSRTGFDANYTREDQAAISAYGEVDHTVKVESKSDSWADIAVRGLLARSAKVPPLPAATVTLRPDDPRVGWYAGLVEPGTPLRLNAELPQYLHAGQYEVLEVVHTATPEAGWTTTLELVGLP